ncbi:hypothetical protein Tco_0849961 [Tanacetum coccineum]
MFVIGGRRGSIAKIGGGSLAKRSMESNNGLGGWGFVFVGGRSSGVSKSVGADGGEVKGGGGVFGGAFGLAEKLIRERLGWAEEVTPEIGFVFGVGQKIRLRRVFGDSGTQTGVGLGQQGCLVRGSEPQRTSAEEIQYLFSFEGGASE